MVLASIFKKLFELFLNNQFSLTFSYISVNITLKFKSTDKI